MFSFNKTNGDAYKNYTGGMMTIDNNKIKKKTGKIRELKFIVRARVALHETVQILQAPIAVVLRHLHPVLVQEYRRISVNLRKQKIKNY